MWLWEPEAALSEGEKFERVVRLPNGQSLGMQTFHIVPDPSGEVCDFCTGRPIHKLYACANFMWQKQSIFPHESVGAWAACRKCSELIESDRWPELSERAFRKFCKRHGMSRYDEFALREQFREIHERFRQHRVSES